MASIIILVNVFLCIYVRISLDYKSDCSIARSQVCETFDYTGYVKFFCQSDFANLYFNMQFSRFIHALHPNPHL